MRSEASIGSELTLALIEVAGGQSTAQCLDLLQAFGQPCIAVLCKARPELLAAYPSVRFEILAAPVPLRRQRAVELAETELVALVEDTGRPSSEFLRGIERAFGAPACAAASGPVSIDPQLSPRQQALACAEYGRYHRKRLFAHGSEEPLGVQRLPGNLLCYRRAPVLELLRGSTAGLIEGWLHERLLAQGAELRMLPELSVRYAGEDRWGARFATRFHHGWIYAGNLLEDKGVRGRCMHALKSLLLPLVLSWRAIGYLRRMPEIERPLVVGAWIVLLEIFWSAGEFLGSLIGKPASMEHWR